MSKLIELDAAIAETWKDTGYSDPLNVMTAIRDRLEALPTVDAVPVRYGHWIEDPDDWEYQCSECRHLSSCRTIYCSACGARMYGKGNGNEAD